MIIVEDGSIVSGANSYVSVADVRQFALDRGVTVPDENSGVERLIFKAMDRFEKNSFKWYLSNQDQPLSFPRSGVDIDDRWYTNSEIPKEVKDCVLHMVLDASVSYDDLNQGNRTAVIRKTVGPITTEYANPASGPSEKETRADQLLRKLVKGQGFGISF